MQTRVALANQLRAQLERFWPGADPHLRRHRQPDRAGVPGALPQPQRRARRSATKRLAGFLARQRYCGRRPPASCSRGCGAARGSRSANSRPTPAAPPSRASSPHCARSSSRSPSSPARSAARSAAPRRRRLTALFRDPKSVVCAAGLLAEIGDNRARYPTSETSPPTQAKHRSRSNPANAAPPPSAGPATNASETTSACSPTAPATGTPGPTTSTNAPDDRGADHPHAIRILGRAWTRVLWRCWQDGVPAGSIHRSKARKGPTHHHREQATIPTTAIPTVNPCPTRAPGQDQESR